MKVQPLLTTFFVSTATAALIAACGGSNTDNAKPGGSSSGGGTTSGGSSSGGSSSSSSSSTSFTCCINNTYYKCPSQAALDRCGNFTNPDPSGCAQQSGSCPQASGGSGDPDDTDDTPPSGSPRNGSTGKAVGAQCEGNSDCASNSCLVAGGAQFGYCSKTCEDFSDCPSFWKCETVGNATAKYCVQN